MAEGADLFGGRELIYILIVALDLLYFSKVTQLYVKKLILL